MGGWPLARLHPVAVSHTIHIPFAARRRPPPGAQLEEETGQDRGTICASRPPPRASLRVRRAIGPDRSVAPRPSRVTFAFAHPCQLIFIKLNTHPKVTVATLLADNDTLEMATEIARRRRRRPAAI